MYDLGSTAGEESDEVERDKALRELIELEAAADAPVGDDDVPVVEISTTGDVDEAERDQALRELVDLETMKSGADEDVPVIDLSADTDLETLDPEQAIREVVELGGRERPRDDEEPVIEITVDELDEADRTRAVLEVVKLGADRPSRRSTARPMQLPTGEASDEVARSRLLLDVVQHAAKVTREYAAARQMESWRSRPIVLGALAISCLLVALYSQIARPEWVYGPDPSRIPMAQRQAHMRFAMALVAQRVYAYRDAMRGFLPQALSDVRGDWPNIAYRALSNSEFELRATDGSAPPLVFHSKEEARAVLNEGRARLRAP